jgi:putative sigma-54 modulation protein
MSVSFAFRKIPPTQALKNHIEKRVEKFEKFVSYSIDIAARLSLEKMYHCVELTVHAEHRTLVAVAKTKDLYESIDMAAHKIEAQLKKERERRKGHNSARETARPRGARLASDVAADLPHREKKQKEA